MDVDAKVEHDQLTISSFSFFFGMYIRYLNVSVSDGRVLWKVVEVQECQNRWIKERQRRTMIRLRHWIWIIGFRDQLLTSFGRRVPWKVIWAVGAESAEINDWPPKHNRWTSNDQLCNAYGW